MALTHKHHIIPKHAGGTDDPENIIELTVEEHAEAHRILFEKYDRWQDYIAWKALSGLIDKEEIRREMSRLYWLNNKHTPETIAKIKEARAKQIITDETRKKMSEAHKGRKITWDLKSVTPEANKKRSESMKKHKWKEYKCPHCGKIGKSNAMKRWHFDNCKEK